MRFGTGLALKKGMRNYREPSENPPAGTVVPVTVVVKHKGRPCERFTIVGIMEDRQISQGREWFPGLTLPPSNNLPAWMSSEGAGELLAGIEYRANEGGEWYGRGGLLNDDDDLDSAFSFYYRIHYPEIPPSTDDREYTISGQDGIWNLADMDFGSMEEAESVQALQIGESFESFPGWVTTRTK